MKYKIGKSKIEGAGKGLLVKKAYRTGEIIGLAHIDDQPATSIGKFHNHSEEPTAGSIQIDNRRYLVAMRDLEPGDEITTDYRQQPELEQPEDFKRGGSTRLPKMPKPSKKGVLGKGYSRSLEATNRLFTENKLFAKPKSRKRKVFDPGANYEEGGSLPQAEYGMPLGAGMSQNYQGRRKFIHQDGGTPEQEEPTGGIISQEEMDASNNAMMRARLAYAQMHGNPAAQRMVVAPDQPYDFGNGMTGTHYMASMDGYAVPQIQEQNGVLELGDYSPDSNEAIRFDKPEDAEYFAEHYKEVSPAFEEAELTEEEIEEYRRGGWVVEELDTYPRGGGTGKDKGKKSTKFKPKPNKPAGAKKPKVKPEGITPTPEPIPQPVPTPVIVNPELQKFIEERKPEPPGPPPGIGADVMPVYDTDELPMYATPDPDAEWVGDTERYIDWDGNRIPYRLPRFRKPGHGGDFIRQGKKRYIPFPSIESRYQAEIVPEEEFKKGGESISPFFETELTQKEIEKYRKNGWIVEEY